jgi:hypothetical protein
MACIETRTEPFDEDAIEDQFCVVPRPVHVRPESVDDEITKP